MRENKCYTNAIAKPKHALHLEAMTKRSSINTVFDDPAFEGIPQVFKELIRATLLNYLIASRSDLIEASLRGVAYDIATGELREQIKALVREELAELSNEEPSAPTPARLPYHNTREIRALILDNLDSIRGYFKDRQVRLVVFADHLRRYTVLREGDLVRSVSGSERWLAQVANAINRDNWKQSPLKPAGPRGHYVVQVED